MEESKFLIITGMSGAGKTQVVRTLEDMNFFCIDNLPPALIPKFAELCRQTQARNTALVVDVQHSFFSICIFDWIYFLFFSYLIPLNMNCCILMHPMIA